MQITDEMVHEAVRAASKGGGFISHRCMRAALEAALVALEATKGSGSKIVELLRAGHPYSGMADDVDLQAAACIEDLAGALKEVISVSDRATDIYDRARATLEKWGLR